MAASNAQIVQDLRGQLAQHASLVKDAGAASRALRATLAERQKLDDITSKDFRDALSATALDRSGCVFPDDVMRQLREARERAAHASAVGIRGSVSATHTGTSQ